MLPEKYFCLFRFFLLLVPFFTAALVVCTTPFHRSLQCCFNQDTNWYHGGCLQCGTIVYIHKKPRETTYAVKYAFMMSGVSKFFQFVLKAAVCQVLANRGDKKRSIFMGFSLFPSCTSDPVGVL